MTEIIHAGVLGMRWGRRRAKQNASLQRNGSPEPKNNLSKYKTVFTKINDARKASATKAIKKDIASFEKHGMKDHADALRNNLKKMNSPKAKTSFKDAMKKAANKKMKEFNADINKRTNAQRVVNEALAFVGAVVVVSAASKATQSVLMKFGDKIIY